MCDRLPGKRCATDTRAVVDDTLAAYQLIGWDAPVDRPEVNTLVASTVVSLGIQAHKEDLDHNRIQNFHSYKEQLQAIKDKHTDADGNLDERAFAREAMEWRDEQIKAAAARRIKQLEKRKRQTPEVQAELANLRQVATAPTATAPFVPPTTGAPSSREDATQMFAEHLERTPVGPTLVGTT